MTPQKTLIEKFERLLCRLGPCFVRDPLLHGCLQEMKLLAEVGGGVIGAADSPPPYDAIEDALLLLVRDLATFKSMAIQLEHDRLMKKAVMDMPKSYPVTFSHISPPDLDMKRAIKDAADAIRKDAITPMDKPIFDPMPFSYISPPYSKAIVGVRKLTSPAEVPQQPQPDQPVVVSKPTGPPCKLRHLFMDGTCERCGQKEYSS